MLKFIVLLLALAAAFVGYPLLNEDASSTCDALERIAVRVIAEERDRRPRQHEGPAGDVITHLLQGASQGQFAGLAVRNQFPELPVSLACTMLYWKAKIDPEGFRKNPLSLGR